MGITEQEVIAADQIQGPDGQEHVAAAKKEAAAVAA